MMTRVAGRSYSRKHGRVWSDQGVPSINGNPTLWFFTRKMDGKLFGPFCAEHETLIALSETGRHPKMRPVRILPGQTWTAKRLTEFGNTGYFQVRSVRAVAGGRVYWYLTDRPNRKGDCSVKTFLRWADMDWELAP